jgi:hypothetical protein
MGRVTAHAVTLTLAGVLLLFQLCFHSTAALEAAADAPHIIMIVVE